MSVADRFAPHPLDGRGLEWVALDFDAVPCRRERRPLVGIRASAHAH